jgi:preprotein translocase subunit SecA
MIFHVEVAVDGDDDPALSRRSATGSSTQAANVTYSGGVGSVQPSALAAAAGGAVAGAEGYEETELEVLPVVEQRRVDEREQIGRNDPCWCGSGQKFKKCHGAA